MIGLLRSISRSASRANMSTFIGRNRSQSSITLASAPSLKFSRASTSSSVGVLAPTNRSEPLGSRTKTPSTAVAPEAPAANKPKALSAARGDWRHLRCLTIPHLARTSRDLIWRAMTYLGAFCATLKQSESF